MAASGQTANDLTMPPGVRHIAFLVDDLNKKVADIGTEAKGDAGPA
jgi:hypothetical protein